MYFYVLDNLYDIIYQEKSIKSNASSKGSVQPRSSGGLEKEDLWDFKRGSNKKKKEVIICQKLSY